MLDFKVIGIIVIVWVLCLAILPLFFFTPQLAEVKRAGGLEYGKLASHYVQLFETRYVKGPPVENAVIGNDIQSLSDLNNSLAVVRNMQIVPLTRNNIIMLAIVTVAPVLPLTLTLMPLNELIKMLAGFLF